MKLKFALMMVLMVAAIPGNAQVTPLALSASVEALGRGADGTVMGIVFQLAPEDRERAGERVRVVTTLRVGEEIADRQSAVVVIEPDGSAMIYRDWDPGSYDLVINIANLNGTATGVRPWPSTSHRPARAA